LLGRVGYSAQESGRSRGRLGLLPQGDGYFLVVLSEFISRHRQQILDLTRQKVLIRMAPRPTESEIEHGVPLFLDQLTEVLKEQSARGAVTDPQLGRSAADHGGDRMRVGFTVDQLVHDYGDVCQAITELAVDLDTPISTDDFRALNKCLDYAIARAVTEFERQRERQQFERENERVGFMAHELRNLITTAKLTFHVLKQGKVAIGGSTGLVLERTLNSLGQMIDRSIAVVQTAARPPARVRVQVSELMEELQVAATIEATAGGYTLEVSSVDGRLEVDTDRLIVAAAVTNLLRNAFKFSPPGSTIALRARQVSSDRLRIEIEDECGGLPLGKGEDLFLPYVQRGVDRSGMGLGLAISREGVRAGGGELSVRDLPGKGCVFTVELPLAAPGGRAEAAAPSA
jgi:signal transduction histidine kinase